MKRLTDNFDKLSTKPIESAFINWNILFRGLFYGDASHVHSEATNFCCYVLVGKEMKGTIITRHVDGGHCTKGGSKVFVQAQPSIGGVITVPVKDNQDGSYTVSYLTNQVKLAININGQHIKGSPYSVQVVHQYSALDKLNKIINDGGRMGKP